MVTQHGNSFRALRRGLYAASIMPVLLVSLLSAQEITYMSPLAGSSDVSQQSTIILRTKGFLDPSALPRPSDFAVQGTKSGAHAGKVVLSDDGHTLIFAPFAAFSPGEEVSVSLHSEARSLNGAPVGPVDFRFSVSSLSSLDAAALLSSFDNSDIPGGLHESSRASRPIAQLNKIANDTLPPGFPTPVVVSDNNPSQRDIFLTTFRVSASSGSVQLAPSNEQYLTILDDQGSPVFYRTMKGVSTDFKLQPNGYLTYFDAAAQAFYELDSTYAVIDSFRCGNGYQTDNHELLILPDGHALLLGLDPEIVRMDQIVQGGNPGAKVIGAVLQELDKDRNVVFQWRSFDHIAITDATHEDLTAGTIDYIHSNAIDVDTDGNLLLSSRHTDEITKINRTTGEIIWRWGGKNNQFTFENDPIGFSHQHSIRRTPTGTLIMFDDGNFHSPQFSRAIEYSMDEQAKTVTQLWQFRHSPDIYAFAMGSVQRMPNGNTLIGWGMGLEAAVTEVGPDGRVAFELRLPDSVVSYRAQSFPWQLQRVVTGVSEAGNLPTAFMLRQNFPNPFNPSTMIQYSVPRQSPVHLKVYDLVGREIATLVEGTQPAGTYSVRFDASRYASGVYMYRLTTPDQSITKTMVLVK